MKVDHIWAHFASDHYLCDIFIASDSIFTAAIET